MAKRNIFLIPFILYFNMIFCQFASVDITLDDRLLRTEEKQDVINMKNDIQRFFLSTTWDDNYSDLSIPIYIQIIFEGLTQKGNESIYNCQASVSYTHLTLPTNREV